MNDFQKLVYPKKNNVSTDHSVVFGLTSNRLFQSPKTTGKTKKRKNGCSKPMKQPIYKTTGSTTNSCALLLWAQKLRKKRPKQQKGNRPKSSIDSPKDWYVTLVLNSLTPSKLHKTKDTHKNLNDK